MSPLESRDLTNRSRVKMFRKDKLDRSVMVEKWDIVKVVCKQPHNKHTQYGLSFITFFKDSDINDNENKPKIGSFAILSAPEDDDEGPKMGSLFAKKKESLTKGTIYICHLIMQFSWFLSCLL
jgi:DNA-repair protein XRCC1